MIKYFLIVALSAVVLFFASYLEAPYLGSALYYIAGPFFEERVTPEELRNKYKNGKMKILIVPGHDNIFSGASFNGVKESDLNVEIGYYLMDFFGGDDKFESFITREKNGNYSPWFLNYTATQRSEIKTFREKLISVMREAVLKGDVKREIQVSHNAANDNTSLVLYGVNKWANENEIDIVLHIHFNDYAGRQYGSAGRYSGFSIYAPESQLPNARASQEVARAIKEKLESFSSASNLPLESDAVIEDQDLIAIGSNGSRNGVSALIEYGYIYEPQFTDENFHPAVIKELAFQTYRGVKNYFEPDKKILRMGYDTTLLPYEWKNALAPGVRNKDVLALQMALIKEGSYPPPDMTLSGCPVSGYFGDCTSRAVKSFQEKYKNDILKPARLGAGTGFVNSLTLNKLNTLYGN